jgi:hypothetical protein
MTKAIHPPASRQSRLKVYLGILPQSRRPGERRTKEEYNYEFGPSCSGEPWFAFVRRPYGLVVNILPPGFPIIRIFSIISLLALLFRLSALLYRSAFPFLPGNLFVRLLFF